MTDMISTALALQKQMLRAQQAQLDAAQTLLDMGRAAASAQAQAARAAEANLRAWQSWSALWGWK